MTSVAPKTRIWVIDASVAAKWFVDEPSSDAARAVLLRLRDEPDLFAVPELFFVEMLSVLSRLAESAEQLGWLLGTLEDLGIVRLELGHELLRRAAELAFVWKLSAYDAVYAASADLLGGRWLTCDSQAHSRIEPLSISSLLGVSWSPF